MRLLTAAFFVSALIYSAGAEHASATLDTPDIGIVYDPVGKTIGRIAGTLGAASVSSRLQLPFGATAAAAVGSTAVAISAEDGSVYVFSSRDSGSRVAERTIAAIDRVVLSASGYAAVLCNSKTRVCQVLSGLPASAIAGQEIPVPEMDSVSKLAVSDDGSAVAIGVRTSVWLIEATSTRASIPVESELAQLAFRPQSSDPYVLLRTGDVLQLTGSGTAPIAKVGGAEDLTAVGFQISTDGKQVFAAYADGTLAAIERGGVALTNCQCIPTGLTQVARTHVYRLNEASSDAPLLLWNTSAAGPRMWFVPAAGRGDQQ